MEFKNLKDAHAYAAMKARTHGIAYAVFASGSAFMVTFPLSRHFARAGWILEMVFPGDK